MLVIVSWKPPFFFIKNYGISILFVFHLVMPVGKQNENIMNMFKVIILVLTAKTIPPPPMCCACSTFWDLVFFICFKRDLLVYYFYLTSHVCQKWENCSGNMRLSSSLVPPLWPSVRWVWTKRIQQSKNLLKHRQSSVILNKKINELEWKHCVILATRTKSIIMNK